MRNKLGGFFFFWEMISFASSTSRSTLWETWAKKNSHKTGLTMKRKRNIVQSHTKFASVFFSHWYFSSFSFNSNAVPSLTTTVASLTPFIHISFLPLLVFLVWDFLGLWPVTTGLATSAVPLEAVLSAAAAGTTVVGFTPPWAAGLFGAKQKAIKKTKLL